MAEALYDRIDRLHREGAEANVLMASIYRLAEAIMRRGRFYLPGYDQDETDLLQEGMLGALKALRLYDPGRGMTFARYMALSINRYMCASVRQAHYYKRRLNWSAIYADREVTDNGEQTIWEMLRTETAQDTEIAELIELLTTDFAAVRRRVFELYFIENLSINEVADAMQMRYKTAESHIERIRRHLLTRLPMLLSDVSLSDGLRRDIQRHAERCITRRSNRKKRVAI